MHSRFLMGALIGALLFTRFSVPAGASKKVTTVLVMPGSPQRFATGTAAQNHCPRDVVVWLNTNSGIYHEKGMRWYGRTKAGAYVCKEGADAADDRDMLNGQ